MIKIFARFFLPVLLLLSLVFYIILMIEKRHQLNTAIINGTAQIEIREANILNIFTPLVASNNYMSRSSLLHSDFRDSTTKAEVLDDLSQFTKLHRYFEQVRIIDTLGKETMRINGFRDSLEVVPEEALQNKSHRDYFKTAMTLKTGEIYLSPIDLNKENNVIDIPYHAIARIISVIWDEEKNRKLGIFITNVSVENLMAAFTTARIADTVQIGLLNYKGEGVFRLKDDVQYYFKDISNYTLQDTLPELWRAIEKKPSGHLKTKDGVYVYSRFRLADLLNEGSSFEVMRFNRPGHSELILLTYIPIVSNNLLQVIPFENGILLLFLLLISLLAALMLSFRKHKEQKMYTQIGDLNDELIRSQYELNKDRLQLENTVKELSRRNTQLKEFSHIISHNIRSPIAGLTLLVDFLSGASNNLTDEERDEITEKLVISTKTLNDLAEDLLETVSILDEGELKMEELRLSAIIDKNKNILTNRIVEANATIKLDLEGWNTIEYNKLYLESIVFNLLSNAVKYRQPDRDLVVKITTEIENGKKVLKISDNGRGINMKWHGNNVFGLHKTFHRDIPGKGFGLFMTKTQIESLGGKISVESEEGVGSTFIIVF